MQLIESALPVEHTLAPITEVIAAIARGEIVVVVDDEDRENEGNLIVAAPHVTAEVSDFMITHFRGFGLPLAHRRARRRTPASADGLSQ